jgi:predicted RNA polymerase sigma factor
VAHGMAFGPERGLALADKLGSTPRFALIRSSAARADFLAKLGGATKLARVRARQAHAKRARTRFVARAAAEDM